MPLFAVIVRDVVRVVDCCCIVDLLSLGARPPCGKNTWWAFFVS
jgi:hypothetical protein